MPKDLWDKFEIIVKSVFIGLLLPAVTVWLVQYGNLKTLQRQVEVEVGPQADQLRQHRGDVTADAGGFLDDQARVEQDRLHAAEGLTLRQQVVHRDLETLHDCGGHALAAAARRS